MTKQNKTKIKLHTQTKHEVLTKYKVLIKH